MNYPAIHTGQTSSAWQLGESIAKRYNQHGASAKPAAEAEKAIADHGTPKPWQSIVDAHNRGIGATHSTYHRHQGATP